MRLTQARFGDIFVVWCIFCFGDIITAWRYIAPIPQARCELPGRGLRHATRFRELQVFERQESKELKLRCNYRIAQEGMPCVLPYLSKQVIRASLGTFLRLLKVGLPHNAC